MTVFIDTSAVIAILDASQSCHEPAAAAWRKLILGNHSLVTSSYVMLETTALLQRRYGMAAVMSAETAVWPMCQVVWVDAHLHEAARQLLITANQRDLSLVDCVSFQVMQSQGLRHALAFDRYFTDRGYTLPALDES